VVALYKSGNLNLEAAASLPYFFASAPRSTVAERMARAQEAMFNWGDWSVRVQKQGRLGPLKNVEPLIKKTQGNFLSLQPHEHRQNLSRFRQLVALRVL
jgi:hypothetical protein